MRCGVRCVHNNDLQLRLVKNGNQWPGFDAGGYIYIKALVKRGGSPGWGRAYYTLQRDNHSNDHCFWELTRVKHKDSAPDRRLEASHDTMLVVPKTAPPT